MRPLAALLALCLAGCTIGQTRVTFCANVAADAGTTAVGMSRGATEVNPLGKFTVPAMLAVSGLIALVAEHAAANGEERKASRLYLFASLIHGGAAIWNTTQLSRSTAAPTAARPGGPRGIR